MTRRPTARLFLHQLEDRTTPCFAAPPPTVVTTAYDVVNPDDGLVSLREAITLAESGGPSQIVFAPELRQATITLGHVGGTTFGASAFELERGVMIVGSGQRIVRADGAPAFRLFTVGLNASLQLRDVELSNGVADVGGAIYSFGQVTLIGTTVTGNVADSGPGGGVYSQLGYLQINTSTVTGNQAAGGAGGVYFAGSGFDVFHATIADNAGEGELTVSDTPPGAPPMTGLPPVSVSIRGSIIARSEGVSTGVPLLQVVGQFEFPDSTFNLVQSSSGFGGQVVSTADPQLGPLQDNGGPTRTRAIASESPAIDAGGVPFAGVTDQRGAPRTVGPFDLGAFESGADAPPG